MNKLEEEVIRQEFRDYWVGYNNMLIKEAKHKFLIEADRRGVEVKGFGDNVEVGMSSPDYELLELDKESASRRIKSLANERTSEIISELLEECVLDYNLLFCDADAPIVNGIHGHLGKVRKKLLSVHKKIRKKIPGRIKDLKEQRDIFYYYYPKSNRHEFQNAIKSLNHLHKYSEVLIDFLENEWPTKYNLDRNVDKDSTKHALWDVMVVNMYRILTTKAKPKYKKMEACKYIAQFLSCVYPLAWTGDLNQNTTRVKNRIYNKDL